MTFEELKIMTGWLEQNFDIMLNILSLIGGLLFPVLIYFLVKEYMYKRNSKKNNSKNTIKIDPVTKKFTPIKSQTINSIIHSNKSTQTINKVKSHIKIKHLSQMNTQEINAVIDGSLWLSYDERNHLINLIVEHSNNSIEQSSLKTLTDKELAKKYREAFLQQVSC